MGEDREAGASEPEAFDDDADDEEESGPETVEEEEEEGREEKERGPMEQRGEE